MRRRGRARVRARTGGRTLSTLRRRRVALSGRGNRGARLPRSDHRDLRKRDGRVGRRGRGSRALRARRPARGAVRTARDRARPTPIAAPRRRTFRKLRRFPHAVTLWKEPPPLWTCSQESVDKKRALWNTRRTYVRLL